MPEQEPRMFPIQDAADIPWEVAEQAYEVYASRYGTSQSLERLAERGGFGVEELDELLPDWRNISDERTQLKKRVSELTFQRDQAQKHCTMVEGERDSLRDDLAKAEALLPFAEGKAKEYYEVNCRLADERDKLKVLASEMKRQRDVFHEQLKTKTEQLEALLGMSTPLPIDNLLERLADSSSHLLDFHDCDCIGHEGRRIAETTARGRIEAIREMLKARAYNSATEAVPDPAGGLWDQPANPDHPSLDWLRNVTPEEIQEAAKSIDMEALEAEIKKRIAPYCRKNHGDMTKVYGSEKAPK